LAAVSHAPLSDNSEDGQDDEMPCVIGESAGDCVWWGSQRSVCSL